MSLGRTCFAVAVVCLLNACRGSTPPRIDASNAPPVLGALDPVSVKEGETLQVTLSATDPEGSEVTFKLVAAPAFAHLDGAVLTLAPGDSDAGEYTVTFEASDGDQTAPGALAVTVIDAADPPPLLSALSQVDTDGQVVAPGGAVESAPVLRAQVEDPKDGAVRLEVEVVELSAEFQSVATASTALGPEGLLSVPLATLEPGVYKWQARALDAAGRSSAWVPFAGGAAAFAVEPGDIHGQVTINANALATRDPAVTLSITASTTSGSPLTQMCFSNDGASFIDCGPPVTSKPWSLGAAQGARTVYVRVEDAVGNEATLTGSIILDTTPPQIGSFAINGGAAATGSRGVILTWSATDAVSGIAEWSASNDKVDFSVLTASPAEWKLTELDGQKTVVFHVVDLAGNEMAAQVSILLDRTAPTVTAFVLHADEPWTNTAAVQAVVQAEDGTGTGPAIICVAGDVVPGCTPFGAGELTVSLSPGDGPKSVEVTVKDGVGNVSDPATDLISVDTVPPVLTALLINGDQPATSSPTVELKSTASDNPGGSKIARIECRTGSGNFRGPELYASPLSFLLDTPEGTATVTCRVYDSAGNVSAELSDSILLDQTPPELSLSINAGAAYANTLPLSVALTAIEMGSGPSKVCLKDVAVAAPPPAKPAANDACFQPFSATASYSVGAPGNRRVYGWLLDHAGNVGPAATYDIWYDAIAPLIPGTPVVAPLHRSLSVTFTNSTDGSSGIEGFEVGLSSAAAGPFEFGPVVPPGVGSTSTTVIAPNGVPSYVVVRAVDKAGNRSNPTSAVAGTARYPFVHQGRQPSSSDLFATAYVPGASARWLIGGTFGALYGSTDGFSAFSRVDPMHDVAARSLFVDASGDVWMAGDNGNIAVSMDNGVTFMRLPNADVGKSDLLGLTFAGNTGSPLATSWYVAVGWGGKIVRGGSTPLSALPSFAPVSSGTTKPLRSVARCSSAGVCSGGGVLVAVGGAGAMLRSTDHGASWTVLTPPAGYEGVEFTSVVAFPNSDILFVGGSAPSGRGSLLRSSTGGATWTEVTNPSFLDLPLVTSLAAAGTDLWIAGATPLPTLIRLNGTVRTNQVLPAGSLGSLESVHARSATELVAAGRNGELLHTTNASTWVRKTTGVTSALNAVSMPPTFNGSLWAVGGGGLIVATTDVGNTWTVQGAGVTSSALHSVSLVDTNLRPRAHSGSRWARRG